MIPLLVVVIVVLASAALLCHFVFQLNGPETEGILEIAAAVVTIPGGLVAILVTTYAIRSEDRARLIQLSGCRLLDGNALEKYYCAEQVLPASSGQRARQALLYDWSDNPVDIDTVRLVPETYRYRLPPDLEALGATITSVMARKRAKYRANDKVAVVTRVKWTGEDLEIGVSKGRLVDEYTTSQNPEMYFQDPKVNTEEALIRTRVEPGTVRDFFSVGSRVVGSPAGRLPSYFAGAPGEVSPGVRLSAHLILILRSEGPSTEWARREILLQKRGLKVATGGGRQAKTSSSGSGMDYADSRWLRGPLRRAWNRHRRFTNYVLRELREEVQIQSKELAKLTVVAVTRDIERMGQPVVILLGESTVTFQQLVTRWRRARKPLSGLLVRLSQLGSRTGWEHWESDNLLRIQVGEIDRYLTGALSDELEAGTRSCLYFLRKLGKAGWDDVQPWRPRAPRGR